MIYLFITALILSATCKAVMDTIRFNSKVKNLGTWWNIDESWKLKWKNGDPEQGERFFGSSTIFVSYTDAWHCFQHFFLFFMFTAMIIYPHAINTDWSWWVILHFLGIYAIFTGSFELIYKLLTPNK